MEYAKQCAAKAISSENVSDKTTNTSNKATSTETSTTSTTYPERNELRDTLGYTNYVVSKRKNLSGVVSSLELKRYYSNIDAEIYIDGEWLSDVQNIDWNIISNKMPLYGFNSYVFDDVAYANRIIQGTFTINFTKPRNIESYINGNVNSSVDTLTYEEEQTKSTNKQIIKTVTGTSNIVSNAVHKALWNIPFDIDIVSGEQEQISGEPVHIILLRCYIIDSQSMRNSAGGVASETYQFIARDFKTLN